MGYKTVTKIILYTSLLFSLVCSSAQPLTLLKKIGQGDVNTQIGLGQSFLGSKLENGQVYFRGSQDGLQEDIWRTDGTSSGTSKVLSEKAIGMWDFFDYVPEGIFLQSAADHLLFYDLSPESLIDLGFFEDELFLTPAKMDDHHYIYLTRNDDTAHLYITDMTAQGTSLLGHIGEYNGFMTLYASPYGAVVYNTNAFSSYIPMMYVAATNEIVTVQEFLSPYKTVSGVKKVALYGPYMFLELVEGGFIKNYIFDLRTHTFYSGNSFFGIVEAFYPNGDELVIVSEREIATMDTTTFQITEWTEEVYPLGTHIVRGDSLYYHGYTTGDTVRLHIFDLNTHAIKVLKKGTIGKNYYSSSIEIHKGALYYTHDNGPTIFLRKYNYESDTYTDIDSITVRNGGVTISNGLIDVNGILLVSKFTPEMWHELYYLNGTTITKESNFTTLQVYPNPCSDILYLETPQDITERVLIFNALGQVVEESQVRNNTIPVSALSNGSYIGIINRGISDMDFAL